MPRGTGAHPGHLRRAEPRRGLGLIGALLFLVNNDEAEVFHRGKHSAAGADDNIRPAVPDAPPLIGALRHGEGAVQHRRAAAIPGAEPLDDLGGQADFRHHDNGPPPFGKGLVDEPQEHLGLAAAGDAIEQRRLARVPCQDGIIGGLLGVSEQNGLRLGFFVPSGIGVPVDDLLIELHRPGFPQVLHHDPGDAAVIAQLLHRNTAEFLQHCQHQFLLFGQGLPRLKVRRRAHHGHPLIQDPAAVVDLTAHRSALHQVPQQPVQILFTCLLCQLLRGLALSGPDGLQQLFRSLGGIGGKLRSRLRQELILQIHAQSRRDQHPHRVKPAAEGVLPQPAHQAELFLPDDG